MKQTSFLNCRLNMNRPRFAMPLGFTVVCLALFFVLGTQTSTAQTMTDIGEVKTADAFSLMQAEMMSLELEEKNPPANVKTERNFLVRAYYEDVISEISKGSPIRGAFMSLNSVTGSDKIQEENPDLSGSALILLDRESSDYRTFTSMVLGLNLADADNSDLEAIFTFWRTLKNQ